MGIESLLTKGTLKIEPKSLRQRFARYFLNISKHVLGGVDLEDLPFSTLATGIYIFSFLALFVGLFVTTIETNRNATYLSTEGSRASVMECDTVSKNISGIFLADYNGYWSTNVAKYNEQMSTFVFEMNAKRVDDDLYREAIQSFSKNMITYRDRSRLRPYWWNMMMLNVWGISHEKSGTRMWLSTDASFTFNTVINVAVLSNRLGVCLGSPQAGYLRGTFDDSQASLQLGIPFKVNRASVFGNVSDPAFQITYLPTKEEPCPHHGKWATTQFLQAVAEYRGGIGFLDFDVRSTLFAIAMNLNLISMDVVDPKTSPFLESVGLLSLHDSWYTFPPMTRIYCINKSSPSWSGRFSDEEMNEQYSFFKTLKKNLGSMNGQLMNYPPMCFLVSARKNDALQLFYPIISQLKTTRPQCVNTKAGCPPGTPKLPFGMSQCQCTINPATGINDAKNIDCNRQSIFLGYIYDTNIRGSENGVQSVLQNDAMIAFAIDKQRELIALRRAYPDDYEMKWADQFSPIFETTMQVVKNPDYANRSVNGAPSSAQALRRAWDNLGRTSKSLSAVVFRSLGI